MLYMVIFKRIKRMAKQQSISGRLLSCKCLCCCLCCKRAVYWHLALLQHFMASNALHNGANLADISKVRIMFAISVVVVHGPWLILTHALHARCWATALSRRPAYTCTPLRRIMYRTTLIWQIWTRVSIIRLNTNELFKSKKRRKNRKDAEMNENQNQHMLRKSE